MGKLQALPPRLASLPPRMAYDRDAHGHSKTVEHWRGWYSLKRWRDLRMRVFTRDLFTCQAIGCGKVERNTSLLVGDHKTPHRGRADLFWCEDNVQTLCKPCHDRVKQAEERADRVGPR